MPSSRVLEPVGIIRELPLAVLASIRFLSGVDVVMLFQLGAAQETFAAVHANERSFRCVDHAVDFETAFCFVHFLADFALEGSLVAVEAVVSG